MGEIENRFELDDGELKSFSTFKTNLENANLYRPSTDNDEKPSHDDLTLFAHLNRRFLRARRFDPVKAQQQFSDTQAWRKQHDVENLFATFDGAELESAKRFYPRWTGRRDKRGHPLYVYRLASLAGPLEKELKEVPPSRRYQRIIALYELMCGFVMPLCTHLPPRSTAPISSATTIIDLGDVSFGSLWNLRSHLQEASALATSNYPETLSTTAIVNCPSFFPTIWNWIKIWFDEGTRSKFHVLGKDSTMLLSAVDRENLPKSYGGELEWNFEDEPKLDKDTQQAIASDVMLHGPVSFVDGKVVKPSMIRSKATVD